MSTYILTSMFPDGIHGKNRELFQTLVTQRKSFAFVASEFEKDHGTTDRYFHLFLKMLEESGIHFENSYVVDGRMDAAEARKAVSKADVVWLAGDDTPVQYAYLVKYGLCDDSVIVCSDEKREFYGEVYKLSNGTIEQLEV